VASAGALVYAAAKKENRFALPNTRLSSPSAARREWARQGPTTSRSRRRQIIQMRERLNRIFANGDRAGVRKRVVRDTDRNFWMSASQACE
jgi:ATP-dependent Clp protease protease subunit